MGDTVTNVDLMTQFACTSATNPSVNSLKGLSMCSLSHVNISNSSKGSVFRDGVEERSVSVEMEGETNPLDWEGLWRGIPLGIVLAVLCLVTTVGNIMVLHAVRTEKRLQTVSNLFIVSLAVADVIVGIIVMPMSAFYIFTERWMLGVAVCQIWMGVDYTASTASILNLFILSLDRYWSVRQPLKYLHKRTNRRALSMIAVVWAVSSLWIIPISSWHYFAHGGFRTVPRDKCDTEYAKNSFFKIITAFFNFYLPLTAMFILYLRIFIAIRKRSEFELGQRYHGGTVLSFKSNIPNSHSIDESECNDDLPCSIDQRYGATRRPSESRSKPHIQSSSRNLRLLTLKRHPRLPNFKDVNLGLYKVEYIYDENVINPQTEHLERYYYEDHYPVAFLPRQTLTMGTERISLTNKRSGLQRSPRHKEDFKMSPKCHSTSSVASCSLRSNGPCLKELDEATREAESGNKQSLSVRTTVIRAQGKCYKSTLKLQESVDLEDCSTQESKDNTFSTSALIEQPAGSFSPSSSASTFEDRRKDYSGRKAYHRHDVRKIRDNGLEVDTEKLDTRVSRDNVSSGSRARHNRQDGVFVNRTTEFGITSNGKVDEFSLYKNTDDSESVLALQDDENRTFSSTKTDLKDRLGTIRQSSSLNKEIKAAKQLGVIMGAFTLCFLPYFILFLVVAFCDNCIRPGQLTAATWIGYLNSTLNPFLYPLCNANFRSKFRSMLACSSPRRSPLRFTQTDYLQRNTNVHPRYD